MGWTLLDFAVTLAVLCLMEEMGLTVPAPNARRRQYEYSVCCRLASLKGQYWPLLFISSVGG